MYFEKPNELKPHECNCKCVNSIDCNHIIFLGENEIITYKKQDEN